MTSPSAASLLIKNSEVAVREAEADGLTALIGQSGRRRRASRQRRRLIVRGGQALIVIVILGAWEAANRLHWLPNANLFYSRPSDVASFIWHNGGILWTQTLSTFKAALIAIAVGVAVGAVCGLALARWRVADQMLDPVVSVLNGLPRIALAPLFLLWFGITDLSKIALSFSVVFFVMLLNARAAGRAVDTDLRTQSALLGLTSRQEFVKIVLPGAVPVLCTGVRLSIAYGFLGVIASEMVAARAGLGVSVVQYGQLLQPAGVFAVLACIAVMVGILNGLVSLAERLLLRWLDE